MRKATVSAACFLLSLCAFVLGQKAQHVANGQEWGALDGTDCGLYLSGFTKGYQLGTLHTASVMMAKFTPDKVSSMTAAQKKDYEESLGWVRKVTPFFIHSTTRSISDLQFAVTTFYADYRNLPVCLTDAVLFSAASLAGNAASEQELAAARKVGTEGHCEQ